MTAADQRRKHILNLLARNRYESILAMSRTLGVSAMTIRRDLDRLENEGLIRRTHGGALTESLSQIDLDYSARVSRNARTKRRIGRAAADLVSNGDLIFLDAGSTVLSMTDFLDRKSLTVVTHSLPVVERLAGRDNVSVFLLGGQVRRDLMSVVGYRAEEFLSTFRIDKAFLGTAGLDLKRGLTHSTLEEIPIKKLAARVARKVIVLADHTKIGKAGTIYFLPISAIDLLITDADGHAQVRPVGRGRNS
jgi:DeoR family transcriptional regulator, fructose operon transcriptional repressor